MKCFEQRKYYTIEEKVKNLAENIIYQSSDFDYVAYKELEKSYNDILENLDDRILKK
tara:strand:+ start:450 stop:620 length:171 start_codon:yes stop_codon:yes gene_type:complete